MKRFILTDECYKARRALDAPPPRPLRTLTCARADTAAFQVLCDAGGRRCILNPGASPALSFELDLPRYRIAVDAPFPARIRAEGYLPDEHGVPCADVLYDSPQTYDGDRYAAAFVTLAIPSDAVPGVYAVRVFVYGAAGARDETRECALDLTLRVEEYVMPAPADYRCYLDLWQHTSNVARAYGVEPWSDAHFALLPAVVRALADLGQKSITVLASDCPWRGWGCYLLKDYPATLYEYAPVAVRKTADGVFRYDFGALKRWIELCFAHGITGDITVYGLTGIWDHMPFFPGAAPDDYPEKVLIRYLDETDGCYRYLRGAAEITDYIRALFAFFRAEGLFARVRIGADEPRDHAAYRASCELLRSIAPDVRFKMALDTTEAIERFGPQTDDLAASFPCSCQNGEMLRALRASGKRVLWYVCNIPDRPNSVLHSELAELRALGGIGYLFGFDGFLRWAFTCWPEKPLEDIRFHNPALPAGDVNFVYPSKNGELLYSLRYYALKKAVEDYELLLRLSERRGPAAALDALSAIIRNPEPKTYMRTETETIENIYSVDYADYETFRARLFALLTKEEP